MTDGEMESYKEHLKKCNHCQYWQKQRDKDKEVIDQQYSDLGVLK